MVGTVAWESVGLHPYTGLYASKQLSPPQGLIRLSEANFLLPEAPGLTPTFAMKFPRSKIPSANILANTSFEPSESYNFFENDFKTRINFFTNEYNIKTIQRKFIEQTETIQSTGLSDFSRFRVDGGAVADYRFPFDLFFAPPKDIRFLFPSTDTGIPWYDQLKTIPAGTILFQAWARNLPSGTKGSLLQHIANIRLTSELTTCAFGDKRLFFKHDKMDADFFKQPTWKPYVPRLNSADAWNATPIAAFPVDPNEQKAWVRGQLQDYSCPFAWLLGAAVNPIY